MHCSTDSSTTVRAVTEEEDDSWWRDERFRTADPQRLLDRLAQDGLLDETGPLLLLLRGSGAQQVLDGTCALRPGLPAPARERHRDGGTSPYDLVMAALPLCGLREEDRWAPFGPERTRAALVLRRTGRVVFTEEDYAWLDGLKYGTNHSGTDYSDAYLVTEHGWTAFLGGRRGEHGPVPRLRQPQAEPAVGGPGQSGAL